MKPLSKSRKNGQDHRFIKKITKPMMGFKAFHSATAAIDGIETAHKIQKGQLSEENMPAYKQSMALAGDNFARRLVRLYAYEYLRQNLYLCYQILRRIKSLKFNRRMRKTACQAVCEG